MIDLQVGNRVLALFFSAVYIVTTAISLKRFGFPEGVFEHYQFMLKALFSVVYFLFVISDVISNKNIVKFGWLSFSYIVLCALSVIWAYSFSQYFTAMISLLNCSIFFLVCLRYGWHFTLSSFKYASILLIFLSIYVYIKNPSLTFDLLEGKLRFSGASYGAHAIARILVIWFALECMNSLRANKVDMYYFISLVFAVAICVLTDSRQAQAVFFVAFCLFFYMKKPGFTIWLFFLLVIVYMLFSLVIFDDFDVVGSLARQDKSEIYTFTNRTFIWEFVINKIHERPLLGFGFGNGSFVIERFYSNESGWTTTSAHNGMLHLTLELGIFGACWFFCSFFKMIVRLLHDVDYFRIFMTFSLFILVFLEQSISGAPDYVLAFLFILISSEYQYKQFIS